MKRLFTVVAAALMFSCIAAQAQEKITDGLEIDKFVHNFGDILLGSGPVTCTFTLKNTGDKPAVIYNVTTTCGCTDVNWTKEPVRPGQSGKISVTYSNDEGPYPFDKSLTVYLSSVKKPVILTDYPKDIKAFYMKQNEDGKTVRAMDVLFPKIGEIIGGSEREASLEKLEARITETGMSRKGLEWYLDTRRFGSAPHSGFGLGFERLLLFVTGMTNIRDVIPFPRTPKNAEY